MTRHSKNNCSSSFFTSYERSALSAYGTQAVRCGADALRAPDTCHICLVKVTGREDLLVSVCDEGHLACRECWLESMLEQKQRAKEAKVTEQDRKLAVEEQRKKEEQEQAVARFEGRKPVPSCKVPTEIHEVARHEKGSTLCMATKHPVSLKTLIPIQTNPGCPSCNKGLGALLEVMLPCGHLYCQECIATVKPKQCMRCDKVCERTLKLKGEGTGFASGGAPQVIKYEPAFQ